MAPGQPRPTQTETNATAEVRRELLFGGHEALDRQLGEYRELLVDRVIVAIAAFAVLFVPASLLRSVNIGWQPLFYAHDGDVDGVEHVFSASISFACIAKGAHITPAFSDAQ